MIDQSSPPDLSERYHSGCASAVKAGKAAGINSIGRKMLRTGSESVIPGVHVMLSAVLHLVPFLLSGKGGWLPPSGLHQSLLYYTARCDGQSVL